MASLSDSASANHSPDDIEALPASAADQVLLYLALNTMKVGGHRYGAFLDAAATAAKFSIYSTYLEQGRNLRKTGFLYHVEPKRVRVIVKEVEAALEEGKALKTLASQEPYYLVGLPHLWQEQYPWKQGTSRIDWNGLLASEKEELEASLPDNLPQARLLNAFEFDELIVLLHTQSQIDLPSERRISLSDAMSEHIKFRLLHSGTVMPVESPLLKIPFYVLTRTTYAPRGERERVFAMIQDVARFFQLLQDWVAEKPGVMRILEVFDIAPADKDAALKELDVMLKSWADKYHQDGGFPMILQMAVGNRRGE
ncbi:MAG: heterocyst differentiation control protein [Cyanobacteria bacterium P01_H01_bin.119]